MLTHRQTKTAPTPQEGSKRRRHARRTVCKPAQGCDTTTMWGTLKAGAGTPSWDVKHSNSAGSYSTQVAIARSNCLEEKAMCCVCPAAHKSAAPLPSTRVVIGTTPHSTDECVSAGQDNASTAATGGQPSKESCMGAGALPGNDPCCLVYYYRRTGRARANASTDANTMSRHGLARSSAVSPRTKPHHRLMRAAAMRSLPKPSPRNQQQEQASA